MSRMVPLVAALAMASIAHGKIPGAQESAVPGSSDREAAHFARCAGPVRVSCVVDGDTFWYGGAKIRLADVNAPEIGRPRCAAEARLGARATLRLTQLLNAGRFTLLAGERAEDTYGRRLFTVTRRGASLGARLEAEGLAARWRGRRHDWC